MSAVAKDAAIKLFGRTISLPEAQVSEDSESLDNESSMLTKVETEYCRNQNSGTLDEDSSFKACNSGQLPDSMTQRISSQEISEVKTTHEESDRTEELKQMKRPDKIVPCPRCNSSDTKFCYFNNYNVNQPRHFCKSCQRYWTAGGTVRNVPIGAGRRRNKHLASQYRQIVAPSDGGAITMVEAPDSPDLLLSCEETSSSCTGSSPNEMVLKFGLESPNCNSVPKVTNQSPKKGSSEMDFRSCEFYEKGSSPSGPPFTGSSYGVRGIVSHQSSHQRLYHCGVPLGPSPTTGVCPSPSYSAPLTVPGCASPSISVQFVPSSYWNCFPVWVAGSGNISLAVPNGCASTSFSSTVSGLQMLGKRSRDTEENEIASDGISPPKTLRIRDHDEA